jgi:hypothetical protein
MTILHESQIRARARRFAQQAGLTVDKSLNGVARKNAVRYDIFLSQTTRDVEIVLGVYALLTGSGYIVFCDWIAAPEADRQAVTPSNAALVRSAMSVSESLLFLDTDGSVQSLWMCWELGWFDGAIGRVAVLPVLSDDQKHYRGREFLGLYPYVEIDNEGRLKIVRPPATNRQGVTIFEAPNSTSFDRWKSALDHMRPRAI